MRYIKTAICVLFVFSLPIQQANAQKASFDRGRKTAGKKKKPLDFGFMLGGSTYTGEFTKNLFDFNDLHLMGGLLIRYDVSENWTLRANALYGTVSGSDANYQSDDFRELRNLHFKSPIIEISGLVEYNFGGYKSTQDKTANAPFVFLGVAAFKFNPKAQFNYDPTILDGNNAQIHDASLKDQDGDWVELQPLGTEGQGTTKLQDRKRYSLTQLSIPLGVGYKVALSSAWNLGIEFGARKTFTDYIDDVSKDYVNEQFVSGQTGFLAKAMFDRSREGGSPIAMKAGTARGNDKTKDWYYFGGLTLTYRIMGQSDACPSF